MRTVAIVIACGLTAVFANPPLGAAQGGPAPGAAAPLSASSPLPIVAPSGPPAHVVDLMTTEGAAVFSAQWRYMDVKLVEAPPRQGAGPATRRPGTYSRAPAWRTSTIRRGR